jgi:hypothetical protein
VGSYLHERNLQANFESHQNPETMNTKTQTKLIRQGDYIAEIDITLTYTDSDWSPYLSLQEAQKLDHLRQALQQDDLQAAGQLARIYQLTPIAV